MNLIHILHEQSWKTWFDKEFLRHKNWEYKALCKIHAGKTICANNYLCWYKSSDKIANKIVKFTNSILSKNNVFVSSIVSRKNRFNNKAKEGHNLQLIQHHNINSFRHTNAKFVFNIYRDKQLTRRFTSFIELIYVCCSEIFRFHSIENIDISL